MGARLLGSLATCLAVSLLAPPLLAAPRTFRIAEFSPDFYATVTVDDKSLREVFRPGSISVFDARTKKTLVTVDADDLAFELDHDVAPVNGSDLPYSQQSLVFFEDFDFDGLPDFAIMDGQKSCYNGPSFQIYLQKKGRRLVPSPEFTDLAQSNCGMFQVDAASRRLHTMMKNGCCEHYFTTYSVVNHVPHVVERVAETLLPEAPGYMQIERTGKPTSYDLNTPMGDFTTPILEFDLAGDKQRHVAVFSTEDTLDYALAVGAEQHVEFSYYLDVAGRRKGSTPEKLPPFRFDAAKGELSFQNGAYRYVICDAPGRLGVEVRQGGRVTFLAGNAQTRAGGLDRLGAKLPTNVERVGP
jgi:hypothetical protein